MTPRCAVNDAHRTAHDVIRNDAFNSVSRAALLTLESLSHERIPVRQSPGVKAWFATPLRAGSPRANLRSAGQPRQTSSIDATR